MIKLKFMGTAEQVRSSMMALLDLDALRASIRGPVGVMAGGERPADPEAAADRATLTTETTATGKPGRKPRGAGKGQTIENKPTPGPEFDMTKHGPDGYELRTDPATAAQDKADEAADGPKDNTSEGVRAQANAYIAKFTFEHACVDLVPCLMKAAGVGTLKELVALNDPAKFEAATVAIRAAVKSDTRYPTEG